jgi:hypothetical protein
MYSCLYANKKRTRNHLSRLFCLYALRRHSEQTIGSMTSIKNVTSYSYFQPLPEPDVARLFSADLFCLPVNKTLFYDDINS